MCRFSPALRTTNKYRSTGQPPKDGDCKAIAAPLSQKKKHIHSALIQIYEPSVRSGTMSTQDAPGEANAVATKHSAKRVSALNEHEDHFLRRKLNTYQRIHDKELSGVAQQLEEIRETIKSLNLDPSYGTHALSPADQHSRSAASTTPPISRNKNPKKLRRTQTFPEIDPHDELHESGAFPSLITKDVKHVRSSGDTIKQSSTDASNEARKAAARDPALRKMAGKSFDGLLKAESSTQPHKKLERSKTAPVTMLQPLLKTTPEMMRKKIHISSSPTYNEYRKMPLFSSSRDNTDSCKSSDFSLEPWGSGSAGHFAPRMRASPLQTNSNAHILIDGRSRGRTRSFEEPMDEQRHSNTKIVAHASADVHHSRTGNFQKPHTWKPDELSSRGARGNTAEQNTERGTASRGKKGDLKQCRYLEFVKQRPENNFI